MRPSPKLPTRMSLLNGPNVAGAWASPQGVAPAGELSTFRMALVGLTLGAQPEMVPSSVAKRKMAGAGVLPGDTEKSGVPLKTMPVGAAGPLPPAGGGMVTTSGL